MNRSAVVDQMQRTAACEHIHDCRRECSLIASNAPSPDFVGRSYRGLVVVAANPIMRQGTNEAHLSAPTIGAWHQVVNPRDRMLLNFDIEDVSYINIVKCATVKVGSKPHRLFKGTGVFKRCWLRNTLPLLQLLDPTHVICVSKGVQEALMEVGFRLPPRRIAAYDQSRHKSPQDRIRNVRRVFDDFYGRTLSDA